MPPRSETSPGITPALDEMAPTRRAILVRLRARGEAGAAELADALGITPGAARQQLRPLVAAGWVTHRDLRPGPGRPRRRYRLAPAAAALFPQAYGELAVELLSHLSDEDAQLVERAFERRGRARTAAARERLAEVGSGLEARLAELARILDEQGYMATIGRDDDGALLLTERNCAILAVAREHRCACASELSFLRELLPDATVERVAHVMAGASSCSYRVMPAGD